MSMNRTNFLKKIMQNKFKSRKAKNNATADIPTFVKSRTAQQNATADISFSDYRQAKDKATNNS